MKAIAVALLVLLLALPAVAQPYEGPDTLWTRIHGFPELSSYSVGDAVPLSDGGVTVSGNYRSLDESQYGPCLTRLDSNGNVLWQRPSHDSIAVTHYSPHMCQIGPGVFLLAAPLLTETLFDPCLTLCDEEGAILWQRVFRLPYWQYVRTVRSSGDGTAVVIFDTENQYTGVRVAEVIKVSDVGDSLWRHDYPIGGGNTSARSIAPTSDGGYVLLGSGGATGEHPILLFKLDADGNVEFFRSYRFFDESEGWDIVELTNGDYVLCGYAMSWPTMQSQALALRVSPNGDSLWSWLAELSQGDPYAERVTNTLDGGFVVQANHLWRFSSANVLLWHRGYSLPHPYRMAGYEGLTQDAQGRFRIVCTARNGVEAVPYLGMLITQPDPALAISPPSVLLPTSITLTTYPNPFNPNTEIRFDLPEAVKVQLKIFNILGQEVATLIDAVQPAGAHRIIWDSKGASGVQVASGVYVYQIKAGGFVDSKKMVLIR